VGRDRGAEAEQLERIGVSCEMLEARLEMAEGAVLEVRRVLLRLGGDGQELGPHQVGSRSRLGRGRWLGIDR